MNNLIFLSITELNIANSNNGFMNNKRKVLLQEMGMIQKPNIGTRHYSSTCEINWATLFCQFYLK